MPARQIALKPLSNVFISIPPAVSNDAERGKIRTWEKEEDRRLQFGDPEADMAFELIVNGTRHAVEADPQTPLLWVVRDHIGLTGTKFSCGIGQCGACTLHVDGRPVRSCSVPASIAVGKPVMTIEGLSPDGTHPLQIAWKELDAPQCGYCQSGMLMSALALLRARPAPTDTDIDAQITNVCRCSTYHRIRKAIHLAAGLMKASREEPR
jgi:isoquinoline 1-oxidoreductase alpha subunit